MDDGPRPVTMPFIEAGPHPRSPLFTLAREVSSSNEGGREQNVLSLSYGRIVRRDVEANEGLLPTSFDTYQVVQPGDCVLRLTDLQNDQRSLRTGPVMERGIITSAYLALRPTQIEPRFMAYCLYAADVCKVFYGMGGGLRQSLKFEDVKRLPLPSPALEDQERIAGFLDDQVARIDGIMAARRAQIDHLRELELAQLTRDVDTLGREHGYVRLRHLLLRLGQGWSPQCEDRLPENGEWGVLKAGCVNGGIFRPDELKALPNDVEARPEYLVKAGDLLVNRASGSLDLIGSAAVIGPEVRQRTLLCDKVYQLSLGTGWLTAFVANVMRSRPVRDLIRLGASGAEGMANNLPSEVIKSIPVPNLDRRLQESFTMSAAQRRWDSDGHVARQQVAIRLLEERKRSLITSAITGEFDISTASVRAAGE